MSETLNKSAFINHIWEKYLHAQTQAPAQLANLNNLDIGCVDELTMTKGNWNPPGGGLFLEYNQYLRDWMDLRRDFQATLGVHLSCGLLYVVEGITTHHQQQNRIKDFKKQVDSLNRQLRTNHQVVVEHQGSAGKYMK